ncbi:MAG: hypothetical protein ABEI27_00170 [Halobellus sp.]|uniref:DUF7266 family protein n=1 Tax=Halobellus sp. TaxID=1979212 RepID=UPI0035D4E385
MNPSARVRRVLGGASDADRGLSPVVGKTLELGIGVLFVALLTATFFGGLVPEYRSTVGAELGDRALVAAGDRLETTVPSERFGRVDRRVRVRFPRTIRGDTYRIVAARDSGDPVLRLVHPHPSIGGRLRLTIPHRASISGSWTSSSPSRVIISVTDESLTIRLLDGGADVGTDASASVSARNRSEWSP